MTDLQSTSTLEQELLLFTCADKKYDFFVVPYIYFALRCNPEAFIEIALEDYEHFISRNEDGVSRLKEHFGEKFLIRQSVATSEPNININTVRFVEQPVTRAQYVYIGDIDILIMQNILSTHKKLMLKHQIPFSNVIRPASIKTGQPRLTGLHFCPYDMIYPLPDISDLDLTKLNDEHILYCIMERRGTMVPEDFQQRPQCGIHMSLNRDPIGRCGGPVYHRFDVGTNIGWQGEQHDPEIIDLMHDATFQQIFFAFPYEFRVLFTALEARARSEERTLHRLAASFLVDRRFSDRYETVLRQHFIDKVDEALSQHQFDLAAHLSSVMIKIWPLSQHSWEKRALSALACNTEILATEALHHFQATADSDHGSDLNELLNEFRDRLSTLTNIANFSASNSQAMAGSANG